jgi:alkanesulfonate monooxygenase SsuD/methylene tetrahydromethanopterin reductase-like flavin-dependent oxidoreductase (luciferase family)
MLGLSFDSGGVRLARMAESLTIIKALLAGERVTTAGKHYSVTNAQVTPGAVQKPRPPILVAGTGPRLLALAAREADIIALGIAPDATEEAVAEKIATVRAAAGDRFEQIVFNIQLMAVNGQVPRWIAANFGANLETWARSAAVPVVTGTPDEICDQLQRRRESLGISYILCSDELMETLAPVVERLTGR